MVGRIAYDFAIFFIGVGIIILLGLGIFAIETISGYVRWWRNR